MKAVVGEAVLETRRLPLTEPYDLSFGRLEEFAALVLRLTLSDGASGTGEVVPLPGYSSHRLPDVERAVAWLLPRIRGAAPGAAREMAEQELREAPPARSLLLTALDSLSADLPGLPAEGIPLVAGVAGAAADLESRIERAVVAGFTTIKVKLGVDAQKELQAPRRIARLGPEPRLRFDANQAYAPDEALAFADAVVASGLADRTDALEQPLPAGDWTGTERLAGRLDLPLMLDESIVELADLQRARRAGCAWVKLKLYKQGGVTELLTAARLATELGLRVVAGNGVASDVANHLELAAHGAYPGLFTGASEANGFARTAIRIAHPSLRVVRGRAVVAGESGQLEGRPQRRPAETAPE
jgi:L-alanine-DL-glutamate epimerase-like enolase superfamily enzyme